MLLVEKFTARGHPNIRGTHDMTIEVTKDNHVTPRGDCIIAVSSEKGLRELDPRLREAARNRDTVIQLILNVDRRVVKVTGRGDPSLTWEHPTDMVARVSGFTCPRTLMVRADLSARGIPRAMIEAMKKPETVIDIAIRVVTTG